MGLEPASLSQVLRASEDNLPNPETWTSRATHPPQEPRGSWVGEESSGTSPRAQGTRTRAGGEERMCFQSSASSLILVGCVDP